MVVDGNVMRRSRARRGRERARLGLLGEKKEEPNSHMLSNNVDRAKGEREGAHSPYPSPDQGSLAF
jgi:hypothetical protein